MIYYSTFKDINNANIRIEIITDSTGDDKELLLTANGLTINYNGDELYKPLLKSGCSIDFLVEDIIPDFYTGTLLKPEVYVYKNNELFWFGYVTPNAYNQPYCRYYDSITVECIDTLSQANNVDFTYINGYNNKATFLAIIEHILNKVDPNKNIKTIFCAKSLSLNGDSNILEKLSIIERNFCDEIDDPMKGDECIEEICRYLGFTMMQYKDAYYIVDLKHLDTTYDSYDRGSTGATNVLSSTPKNIATVGVRGSNTNITLDGLYNKVSIVASTLKIEDPISSDNEYTGNLFGDLVQNSVTQPYEQRSVWVNPEISDNMNDYQLLHQDFMTSQYSYPKDEHIWSFTQKEGWDEYKLLSSWWKTDGDWTYKVPFIMDTPTTGSDYNGPMSIDKAYEIYASTGLGYLTWREGATWQKTFSYKVEDGAPPTLDWKQYFTISCQNTHAGIENYFLAYERPIMTFKGGAFMINFEFYLSYNNTIAMKEMHEPPVKYDDSITNDTEKLVKERRLVFPAKLSVGNYYWNGESWVQYTESFIAKLDAGYFDYTLHSEYSSSDSSLKVRGNWMKYIWKIWNSTFQDWEYVTETTYNNFIGTKDMETIPTVTNAGEEWIVGPRIIYYIQDKISLEWIQVPASYQNQFVSDRFFLAKKFPNESNVYGTTYKLDNTTTFEMNLNDASQGIALQIPSDLTLSGTFRFSIGRPTKSFEALTPNAQCGESIGYAVCHISDMYVKYSQEGDVTSDNDDIVYSNVIAGGYINELDDVTMKVNTYTDKMTSYSYVFDGDNFLDELTYENTTQIQEHNIIEKLVNHYSDKKITYSTSINNDNITPCTLLTDTTLNKTMPIVSIEYNMCDNSASVTCIEI